MKRSVLYGVIAALVLVVIVLAALDCQHNHDGQQ
jgi:flagellin-like protein